MRIIGITGTLGAGKGTIVNYLKEKGFAHYSARAFINEHIKEVGDIINRDTQTQMANELREKQGPDFIIRSLYEKAHKEGTDAVIESVRAVRELDFLRTKPDFYLISIDADPKLRYERIVKRGSKTDHVSYEKFLSDEEREMHNTDETKGNIAEVMKEADYSIENSISIEDLYGQVEVLLGKIKK